jgi:hypothetical protein
MKPFNIDEALAGKPVTTTDGREVTQLIKFEISSNYKLTGVVDGELKKFTIYGKSYSECTKDLVMATEKKSIWVNVFEKHNGDMYLQHSFNSKESAQSMIPKSLIGAKSEYIKTIEITNEL